LVLHHFLPHIMKQRCLLTFEQVLIYVVQVPLSDQLLLLGKQMSLRGLHSLVNLLLRPECPECVPLPRFRLAQSYLMYAFHSLQLSLLVINDFLEGCGTKLHPLDFLCQSLYYLSQLTVFFSLLLLRIRLYRTASEVIRSLPCVLLEGILILLKSSIQVLELRSRRGLLLLFLI
jgi:hypothetical protein